MRRRVLVRVGTAVAAVLAASGAVASVTRAAGQAASANVASTVTVDLSASQGAFPFAPGGQLSATPNSWRYGPSTMDELSALRLQRARVWLRFTDTVDPATGTPDYAKWYDYLATYSSLADSVLVNWSSGYDTLVGGGSWTPDRLFAAERDMLAHYKARYPRIQYLEVENEAVPSTADVPGYYRKYQLMYRVVNAVNALGLPGPAIQVGGPTLDVFSTARLGAFLDAYKADADTAKRLDFVSYHQYLINISGTGDWTANKDYPAIVKTEKAGVDGLLSARGLAARPVLVTETGVFPGTRESSLGLSADWHIQAAALASLRYWYLQQGGIVPFDWTIDHPDNDRKDLFADTGTGVARPYYDMVRAMAMLPGTRYRATSDQLSSRGTGVYGLAAANATTVAALTWNYQWTGQQGYDSRVVFTNLPAAFRSSNVRVTRYRVPADADSDASPLTPVETFVVGPRTAGSYYGQTLPLLPNELRLTTLTPTTDPVT
ncbi:MAG: hypothetical protein ACJ73S_04090 [Mycobacteriales bacterium]